MQLSHARTHSLVALFVASWLAPAVCEAAEATDHLNTQVPALPGFLPRDTEVPFQLPPVPAPDAGTSPAGSTEKFKLERVRFHGNTVFSTDVLVAIAAPFAGREISLAQLEELRQLLTRHYVDRGYVNSGVLIGSGSADGVVLFEVVEGILSSVRLRGLERLDENYVVRRLVHDSDGPFNLDVVRERYQLLLGDPLFLRMNARLMPDARPGEATLDIDAVRARPYHLSVAANNYRPPSIGANAVSLSGWVRNLTGQGDVLEASVQAPPDHASESGYNIAWRMPIGFRGTQLSVAFDHDRSAVIEEPMKVLNIKSTHDTRDIGISQTIAETLRQKISIGINSVKRESRTSLLGMPFSFNPGEVDGVLKETIWRFWQEYTYRSETQVVALRSTFNQGKNDLQVIAGLPPVLIPDTRFRFWLGQVQYARQVMENGAQIVVRGTRQDTGDRLTSIDSMSIGGVSTVRGFRENQLVRALGETVNIEFEYPLASSGPNGLNTTLTPFYDFGRGRNQGSRATTIDSVGIATRVRWRGFGLDLVLAKPLRSPEFTKSKDDTLQDKGVHVQLSYDFFGG